MTLISAHTIRKLFGCKARIGDEVAGSLDVRVGMGLLYSCRYEGVVKEDHSNWEFFPHHIVDGKRIIDRSSGPREEKDSRLIVPAFRVYLK